MEMTFRDGYPHAAPDVKLLTRVWSLHVLSQVDGSGRLLPLLQDGVWDSTWTMRSLVQHVTDVLREAQECFGIHLLPSNMRNIAKVWLAIARNYYKGLTECVSNEKSSGSILSKDEERISDSEGEWDLSFIKDSHVTPPSLEILCSHADAASLVQKLSRVEQLHLNVVYLFIFSREKYDSLAVEYSKRFKYFAKDS